MALYLVTTGWQGNGMEGVIIIAHHGAVAIEEAADHLAAEHQRQLDAWLARHPSETSHAQHLREKLADCETRDLWSAKEIELPYIGEFG